MELKNMINLHNQSPKLLVIGDLMIDQYLWGSCDRVSPEAPVQVINVNNESAVLGGAGNVVNNLKKLGADVDILSVIGTCQVSKQLCQLLSSIEISTKNLVVQKNRLSSKKTRVIASQQQVVRYDRESSEDIDKDSQNSIIKIFEKVIHTYDMVLFSDYGKGVLTKTLTQKLIKLSNKYNIKVLIDPKGNDYSKYKGAFTLTPNKKEASEATNIDIVDDSSLKNAIIKLKSICNLELSLITLSENGIAIFDNNFRSHPTSAKEVYDVTGAGDTVLASLGYALACQLNIDEAVKFSNLASGVVVGKIGSATVTLNEIIQYESSLHKSSSTQHIKTLIEITDISEELKSDGKKIVFTNGCFDLLHAGHINYLEAAKSFGDVLIIGVNSDRSVKTLKGKERPVNCESDRAYILAALEVVDYVVIFDDDTPLKLIKAIKPNTLVKGGDYKGKEVVGQHIADELKLVDFLEGKSSSQTINKIKQG
jgi:D-beta-D-heptose 7-phosphate kinase / D-beta-D-heptose 1-phosphate adenosyltransferase